LSLSQYNYLLPLFYLVTPQWKGGPVVKGSVMILATTSSARKIWFKAVRWKNAQDGEMHQVFWIEIVFDQKETRVQMLFFFYHFKEKLGQFENGRVGSGCRHY